MAVAENSVHLNLAEIIVATDFQPASEKALAYARALAKLHSSTVTLNHVIDLSVATPNESALVGIPIEQMRGLGEAHLDREVKALKREGIKAQSRMLEAFTPGEAIVDLSRQMNADLIVMGTNSRRGIDKWIMGSCAEGVIHHATCPVLTVGPNVKPPAEAGFFPRTILFATDLEHETAAKAAAAIAFAEENVATIYMAHVIEDRHKSLRALSRRCAETEEALREYVPDASYDWCDVRCITEFGKPAERILHLAKERNADLIILGSRRSTMWFTHLFTGVVGHVIAEAEVPVISLCTS